MPSNVRRPLLACAGLLVLLAAVPAGAQSIQGDPADLRFAVVNATTGEPDTVERMTIAYVRTRPLGILDFEPEGTEFVAPGVPVKDVGQYIVAVWKDGVPYWWSKRGRELLAGTTTLHVFSAVDDIAGVAVTGLDLVIRQSESLLAVEMMLRVENTRSPQETVFAGERTLSFAFPSDAGHIEATYKRGPDPEPIAAELVGSRLDLAVPLTPGGNQVRIRASVPWRDGLVVPVGANVPVAAWNLLTSPDWLEVQSVGMETATSEVPGYKRLVGPALEPGRTFELRLASGRVEAGEAEDLFTTTPTADAPGAGTDRADGGGGFPLPFVFAGVLIIIVIIAVLRRRR